MEYKLITEAEYRQILKKLDSINATISEKIEGIKEIYSETEMSELLSTSKRTLINWRNKRLINFSKIEGKIFYTRDNVQEFLKRFEIPSDKL